MRSRAQFFSELRLLNLTPWPGFATGNGRQSNADKIRNSHSDLASLLPCAPNPSPHKLAYLENSKPQQHNLTANFCPAPLANLAQTIKYVCTNHEPLIITRCGKAQAHNPALYNRENEPRLSWEELKASLALRPGAQGSLPTGLNS